MEVFGGRFIMDWLLSEFWCRKRSLSETCTDMFILLGIEFWYSLKTLTC